MFLLALPIGLGLIVREQRSWLPQLIYQGKDVSEMKLSPDGKLLAIRESAGNKAKVTVVDAQSGKVRRRITILVSGRLISVSPDSKRLVVGDLVVVKQKFLRYQLSIHDLENGTVRPGALLPEDAGANKLVWESKLLRYQCRDKSGRARIFASTKYA